MSTIDVHAVETVRAKIDAMIGMETVEKEIDKLVNGALYDQQRAQYGLPPITKRMHMAFVGPAGTGKTTVAQQIGPLYKALGIVPKGQFVEVKRAQLVGDVVGATERKTTEAFNRAKGGVLFVDEAYALTPKHANDYGQVALETLMTLMEENRNDTVVIFAGYPHEMERFKATNPGLASRIPTTIHFHAYSDADMTRIFEGKADADRFKRSPATTRAITRAVGQAELKGNARDLETLYSNIVSSVAARSAASSSRHDGLAPEREVSTILPRDVATGLASFQATRAKPKSRRGKLVAV